MAVKPTVSFTWSTDANFSSGPASGNPTKVNPPGFPTNLQGMVPGDAVDAEHVNTLYNNLGLWTGWLDAGANDGGADAHIVESDASGDWFHGATKIEFNANDNVDTSLVRLKQTGTGATVPADSQMFCQIGRDQTGATANNDGGDFETHLGPPGTGGSGAVGQTGRFTKFFRLSASDVKTFQRTFVRRITTTTTGLFTAYQEAVLTADGDIMYMSVVAIAEDSVDNDNTSHQKQSFYHMDAGPTLVQPTNVSNFTFEAGDTGATADIVLDFTGNDARVRVEQGVGGTFAWTLFITQWVVLQ